MNLFTILFFGIISLFIVCSTIILLTVYIKEFGREAKILKQYEEAQKKFEKAMGNQQIMYLTPTTTNTKMKKQKSASSKEENTILSAEKTKRTIN